jgi:hypothetical protein
MKKSMARKKKRVRHKKVQVKEKKRKKSWTHESPSQRTRKYIYLGT